MFSGQKELLEMSNSSNDTNLTRACLTPHLITSSYEFFMCYKLLFMIDVPLYVFEIMVILLAVVFNTFVMISIYFYSISYTVFDQILIGHCIIQALTATVDIPFFHFMDVFGYWALPDALAVLWAIYDNNINTTTNLTMLYMCWTRLRSIQAPTKFKEEFLIRWPKLVMASIWAFGLGIWTIISLIFGTHSQSTRLNYDPAYLEVIFNFVFWLVPLLAILGFSVKIVIILNIRSLRKMYLSKKVNGTTDANSTSRASAAHTNNTRRVGPANSTTGTTQYVREIKIRKKRVLLTPQVRFMLIIFIYWIQWIIPCLTVLIDGMCACVPGSIFTPIYWLTYTVVFTDPLTILALNPNLRFCWSS